MDAHRHISEIFGCSPVLIGMLHVPALPGTPASRLDMRGLRPRRCVDRRHFVESGRPVAARYRSTTRRVPGASLSSRKRQQAMILSESSSEPLDLVVFGNLLLDDIVRADGSTRMAQPGGAVLYVALAARLNGLRVGIVSVVGNDYPPQIIEQLTGRGIDLALRRRRGPSLRAWLLDEGRQRQLVHRLAGPSHAEMTPEIADLPAAWKKARAFHLAPMPRTYQSFLSEALEHLPGEISLDPYDLLEDGEIDTWKGLLATVDTFFLSEDEACLTGDRNGALRSLIGTGKLRRILFKQGDRGGVSLSSKGSVPWSAVVTSAVDTTGAGDAFAAGFLAGRLRGASPDSAMRRGAVTAALAIADEGPEGLFRATPEDLENHMVMASGLG